MPYRCSHCGQVFERGDLMESTDPDDSATFFHYPSCPGQLPEVETPFDEPHGVIPRFLAPTLQWAYRRGYVAGRKDEATRLFNEKAGS